MQGVTIFKYKEFVEILKMNNRYKEFVKVLKMNNFSNVILEAFTLYFEINATYRITQSPP